VVRLRLPRHLPRLLLHQQARVVRLRRLPQFPRLLLHQQVQVVRLRRLLQLPRLLLHQQVRVVRQVGADVKQGKAPPSGLEKAIQSLLQSWEETS